MTSSAYSAIVFVFRLNILYILSIASINRTAQKRENCFCLRRLQTWIMSVIKTTGISHYITLPTSYLLANNGSTRWAKKPFCQTVKILRQQNFQGNFFHQHWRIWWAKQPVRRPRLPVSTSGTGLFGVLKVGKGWVTIDFHPPTEEYFLDQRFWR